MGIEELRASAERWRNQSQVPVPATLEEASLLDSTTVTPDIVAEPGYRAVVFAAVVRSAASRLGASIQDRRSNTIERWHRLVEHSETPGEAPLGFESVVAVRMAIGAVYRHRVNRSVDQDRQTFNRDNNSAND